jgi:hypothetical protein
MPVRVPARGGVNRAPQSRVALPPLIGASLQQPPSAHLTRHLDISPRRQHISILVSTASSTGVHASSLLSSGVPRALAALTVLLDFTLILLSREQKKYSVSA